MDLEGAGGERLVSKPKVVLYNPDAVFYTMPLGLLAVASALDTKKYDVVIVDARLESDVDERLRRELPGALLLGVTVLTGAPIRDALRASRFAKSLRSDLPVVWGGWHPSLFPTKTLEADCVDVTVQGQGESSLAEVSRRLERGESLEGIPGTCFRERDRVIQNPPRALEDMNGFPAHRYERIDVERYMELKSFRQLDYIGSTGCNFRCNFCADPFVFERKWSGLEPKRMGEEIEALWQRYSFQELAFQDETFFTHRPRVMQIADEILTRELRFQWTATMRADQGSRMPDEEFALCKRSGLRLVLVGVESGNPEMLEQIAKDITIDQVIETAEKCARHGISIRFPFIVGFPDESEASVTDTLGLIKRLEAMSPSFRTELFYYKPYPGSPIASSINVRWGLPDTLEQWADFDYVESRGPWVSNTKYRTIERFKFYSRFAWSDAPGPARRALRAVSRWRCDRDFYGFPLEKTLAEVVRPPRKLS